MAPRRKIRQREAQLAFEALTIEGGLLSPDWLSRIAQLAAGSQSELDYRVPKGLNLRDEIGRYWRIAQAHWSDFAAGKGGGADKRVVAERFVKALLGESFGFVSLGPISEPQVVEGRRYPVGFFALGKRVPVVIAPAGVGLDEPAMEFGDEGRRRTAFGLCQEYLNAEPACVWGLVSDGVTLRILRDNASLTRPAWAEASLERIFTEERYADFAALWLLVHESRFGRADQAATDCALEAWRNAGREEGTRAREHLRQGVEEALIALGGGFLAHPENQALRAALNDGTLTTRDYFNQLLRLVYRLIFVIAAEERGVLHTDGPSDEVRKLYAEGYSLRRLRERSTRRSAHDRFSDLWASVRIVFRGLAKGQAKLELPALAGLFAEQQCRDLDAAKLENRSLLAAMFKLCWLKVDSGLSRVNWRDMGPEELGSVYEGLLELVPQIKQGGRSFEFATGGETKGNARKTTGSYYTPDSLVQVLLDSALDPVVKETIAKNPGKPVEALLQLSIVDPACGSGHFLLAAARRLAVQVARLTANGTPSAAEYRHALRQVVGRCIFGVDLNPMAVELCRVSLWMEAVEPGKPLTFLDSHIQQGNSLIGTTPELMAKGIPDAAWEPIEGDDRRIASALKKRNKAAAKGQRDMATLWSKPTQQEAESVAQAVARLDQAPDGSVEELATKQAWWNQILLSSEFHHQKFIADLWCAAFLWPKKTEAHAAAAPTNDVWRQLRDGQGHPPPLTRHATEELTRQYSFFHWHLAFPQVFARGGFDVVLGNPPWDTLSPDRREYFISFNADIRSLPPSEQNRVVEELLRDPKLAAAWLSHQRALLGLVHFLKNSRRFSLYAPGDLGKGDFNVYRMFIELAFKFTRPGGFAAQIVPAGFRGGANASAIRQHVLDRMTLQLMVSFINTGGAFFSDVHAQFQFILYAARQQPRTESFFVAFGITSLDRLTRLAKERILLTAEHVRKQAPETYAIPDIRDSISLAVASKMTARHPAFGEVHAGPPMRHYMREIDMGNDSHLFTADPRGLPLYEGKMVGAFDHRAKSYDSGHGNSSIWTERPFGDPKKTICPHWRVMPEHVPPKLGDRIARFRLGFRDVAQPTDFRSLIATLIPPGVLCGHKVPTITFEPEHEWAYLPWLAVANSFVMDWMARSKLTSPSMTYSLLDTLPFPRPRLQERWVRDSSLIVLRLVCTSSEMTPFWNAMAKLGLCNAAPGGSIPGDSLTRADEREAARADLDAIVAHNVFGLSRPELEALLDAFPIVKKHDFEACGEHRTKRMILERFDALARKQRRP